jgi:hypothetical protein
MDSVTRVQHDVLSGVESLFNQRFPAVALTDADLALAHISVSEDENRPVLSVTKQRTGRDFHRVVLAEHHYPGIHAVPVTDVLPLFTVCDGINHYVYALFLDAEGGNLGEPGRLD